jgi:poly(hydroxyalkanoate) granule-associated protein
MGRKTASTSDFTDTAHDVWLAGLGAMAAAGDEGEKLFRTLVARGKKAEKNVMGPVDRAGTTLRKTVKTVRTRAGRSIGSIQSTIDNSVASALHRLGVPTRKEISELSRKVEKLTRAVNGHGSPKKKTATRKSGKKAGKALTKKTTKRRTTKKTAS